MRLSRESVVLSTIYSKLRTKLLSPFEADFTNRRPTITMKTFDCYAPHVSAAIRSGLDFNALRAALDEGMERLLPHSRFQQPGRILFTGSGDSMFAAISALPAFRRWTGLPAQSLSAP